MARERLVITTSHRREVVDITDDVVASVRRSGLGEGICYLFLTHTTAALTTADLDPGTDRDILDALEAMVPKLKYRHPHDPTHTGDHILSSLLGTSLSVPVEGGELLLGEWQRIVLIEFSGPRKREIVMTVLPHTPSRIES